MLPFAIMTAALWVASPSALADARIQTFGDACLSETPMSREALAAMAQQRGWDVGQTDTPADLEWRDLYRHGSAIIRLDQHRATAESPGERICVVLVGNAPRRWQSQVSGLRANGAPVGSPGTYDTAVYQMPPGLELVVWDLPDGSRIHALRDPDNILELSVNYPTGR